MDRRVVVTGMGIICSLGTNIKEFWSNCLKGKTRVEPIPQNWLDYADYSSRFWSPLPETDFEEYGLTPLEQKNMDKSSLLILASTIQAIKSAKLQFEIKNKRANTYTVPAINLERVGVFIGTGAGGIHSMHSAHSYHVLSRLKNSLASLQSKTGLQFNEEQKEALQQIEGQIRIPKRFNPFTVTMSMPDILAAGISVKFGLSGPANTYCSSSASGTVATGNAFRAIKDNLVDMAVSGGVEFLNDDYGGIFKSLDLLNLLAKGESGPEINRPFDQNRTGALFSEGGAGVLVLEELEHAQTRGAPIIAEVVNYAENSDAHSLVTVEESGVSLKRMLHACLTGAGITPDEIDYINAHGTGTVLNDEIEARIIEEVLGRDVLINTTKSLTGYTFGASGAIGAIVTVLSINNKTTHICKNLKNPVRDLNFVMEAKYYPIKTAISQSFGFGGHNSGLIFREFPRFSR